ncbi:conserved hypothetical protein [Bradyrhizobium oligotrophicum S58]|uniref:Uncharacterized protein n=1 Tax=Bradyrhizobium oligotrophicum S58 TaxID=1245469 RepID=M4ZBU1_9BRAD|nr:hypothetical protein [Bradyrhizobium oligotrophicum]BAM91343.1 conserved hypothetical protein [Bradyrhizobium oligotrophicum S58]
MANQRPHAYDFFMIVCGGIPSRERMAHPAPACAIARGSDLAPRQKASKELEFPGLSGGTAADELSTGKEPQARLEG